MVLSREQILQQRQNYVETKRTVEQYQREQTCLYTYYCNWINTLINNHICYGQPLSHNDLDHSHETLCTLYNYERLIDQVKANLRGLTLTLSLYDEDFLPQ